MQILYVVIEALTVATCQRLLMELLLSRLSRTEAGITAGLILAVPACFMPERMRGLAIIVLLVGAIYYAVYERYVGNDGASTS